MDGWIFVCSDLSYCVLMMNALYFVSYNTTHDHTGTLHLKLLF